MTGIRRKSDKRDALSERSHESQRSPSQKQSNRPWAILRVMLSRPIPSSNEALPVIGLGTWQTFDAALSDSASVARLNQTVRALYDAGGRIVDSSPMYGRSEQTFGAIAAQLGLTDDLFVATKVWTSGERAGIDQMRRSATYFHRKALDLMQVHNLVDWKTHLATL